MLAGQDKQSKEEEQQVDAETCKRCPIKVPEDRYHPYFSFIKRQVTSELFGVASMTLPRLFQGPIG